MRRTFAISAKRDDAFRGRHILLAEDNELNRKIALECGMNGFLTKHINIEELFALLGGLLAG